MNKPELFIGLAKIATFRRDQHSPMTPLYPQIQTMPVWATLKGNMDETMESDNQLQDKQRPYRCCA